MTSTAVVGLPIAGRRPSTEIGDALGALKAAKDLLRNLIVLMGAMSNYMEDAVVKHFYRTGSFTKPTVLAVGLYTAAPGETGGGTEVTGGSYARAGSIPSMRIGRQRLAATERRQTSLISHSLRPRRTGEPSSRRASTTRRAPGI
jgi:hypothetical protein